MRILWYTNAVLPEAAQLAQVTGSHTAGWISGFLQGIGTNDSIELGICSPCEEITSLKIVSSHIKYYLFPRGNVDASVILQDFKPDILHVFGTESTDAIQLIRTFASPDRTIVNIQGMCGLIAETYFEGIDKKELGRPRLFEKIYKHSLQDQQASLIRRSELETQVLLSVSHVIGRTDIDRMFSLSRNPAIRYHFCNEILREEFYTAKKWDVGSIDRYTMFFRANANPIKGLHMVLRALPAIVRRFPSAQLVICGQAVHFPQNSKQRLIEGAYNRLLRKAIETSGCKDHITYIDHLSADGMVAQFLRSHVVISASQIENECNFISEAKLLGVPSVASFVGGLPNRIQHGVDGFLYPFNMPSMLAYYITRIFEDDQLAESLSKEAIKANSIINDRDRNTQQLLRIYHTVYTGS